MENKRLIKNKVSIVMVSSISFGVYHYYTLILGNCETR